MATHSIKLVLAQNLYDISGLEDVSGGKVDTYHIVEADKAFGCAVGQTGYNPLMDFNQDGKVDIKDIVMIAMHFGEGPPDSTIPRMRNAWLNPFSPFSGFA